MDQTIKARRREIEKDLDAEMIERQKFSLEARRLRRQLNGITEQKEELEGELKEAQRAIDSLMVFFHHLIINIFPLG